jgi:hypothetical protein
VLDPVSCDLERVHRHGDAVALGDQPGLAVDRALAERHARGRAVEQGGDVACDLLAAFDRVRRGADQAAAVAGHGGAGV